MAAAPADLFGDAQAVEERWREIRQTIDGPLWPEPSELQELPGLVLCNNGDSGRMTVAILRARGVEAFTIEGGYDALAAWPLPKDGKSQGGDTDGRTARGIGHI